jgi:hypothetical protein
MSDIVKLRFRGSSFLQIGFPQPVGADQAVGLDAAIGGKLNLIVGNFN